MLFSIKTISLLFIIYLVLFFILKNTKKSYSIYKIFGLILTFSIYLIVLDFLFYFDCLSTKFQALEHFFYVPLNLEFYPKEYSNILNFYEGMQFDFTYGVDGISIIFILLVSIITPLLLIINWEQSLFPIFLLNNIIFLEFCLLNLFWTLDILLFFFFWS